MQSLKTGIKQFLEVPKTVSCRVVVGKKNQNLIGIKDDGKILIPNSTEFRQENKVLSELAPETRILGTVLQTHDRYDKVELFCIYNVDGTMIVAPAYVDYEAYADQLRSIKNSHLEEWMTVQNELKDFVIAKQNPDTSKPLSRWY